MLNYPATIHWNKCLIKWEIYDPSTHDERHWVKMNAHEKVSWIAVLESIKETIAKAGYSNPTYLIRDGYRCIAVDEDEGYYDSSDPRVGLFDIVRHTGIYAGCASNNTAQINSLHTFLEEGLDETHSSKPWSYAPCHDCFPEKHAIHIKTYGSRQAKPTGTAKARR